MYGKLLKLEKQDAIGTIILDNAAKFNVIGTEFLDELEALQQELAKDLTLKAIAIVANGENFSAGIDLKFLKTVSSAYMKAELRHLQELYSFWQKLAIPVVVGVQGYCFGSGVELILGCDIRVAAKTARFSLPEVKFGLAPDMGGTTRLTKLVGVGQAKRIILTGDEINADEAHRIGLVEFVVPLEELKETTLKLATKMSLMPSSSMRFAKKGINLAAESSVATGLLFEEAQSIYCCGTEDLKEAVAAFMEKRMAVFNDR